MQFCNCFIDPVVRNPGAYVDLKNVIAAEWPIQTLTSAESLLSDAVFQSIKEQVETNVAKAKQVNGVFLYIITKQGKPTAKWLLDLKNGRLLKGDPPSDVKIDTTLTVDDQVMVDIATGKLNPQAAFMKGKLKIKGNLMLTQKLQTLMTNSKL